MSSCESSSPEPESSRSLTNTKTSVKEMKAKLGILGDPKEEDKWAQFNRASRSVYEAHKFEIDACKTWRELAFDLRHHLIQSTFVQFPEDWKSKFRREFLEAICNTRLFRLHHLRRLKSSKAGGMNLLNESSDLELEMHMLELEQSYRPLPYDPVRQV